MKIYTFVIALTLISVITSDLVANDPSDATNARAYSIPLPTRQNLQSSAPIRPALPLVIAGDQNDVSGFDDGIRWAYENAVSTDRNMLVYQNGRHSIGGNPEPPIADEYFDLTDWFNEPVWRRDRVVGINQHFITAFLNLHLKEDASAATFMNVSPERSNHGQ